MKNPGVRRRLASQPDHIMFGCRFFKSEMLMDGKVMQGAIIPESLHHPARCFAGVVSMVFPTAFPVDAMNVGGVFQNVHGVSGREPGIICKEHIRGRDPGEPPGVKHLGKGAAVYDVISIVEEGPIPCGSCSCSLAHLGELKGAA